MNTEQKAQAYDKALEIARQYYEKDSMNAFLDTIFPELAESEDERIRKRLIEYFEGFRMGNAEVKWEGLNVQEVLVWLEKQKECVSNNFNDVWDEEDCEEIIAEGQKLTPRFKELLKEVCHAWYDRGAKLEKQKEQKPAEWSEEDEKTIDDAFCWLCEYAGSLIQKNYGKSSMLYGIANKLKSLHPQYHGDVTMTEAYKMGKEVGEASRWKPTEHQMTILKVVKEYVGKGSGYWGEGLGSLIDDLEKL